MLVTIILALVAVVNGIFVVYFVRDLIAHKGEFMKEPGNPIVMAISSFIIFLLS